MSGENSCVVEKKEQLLIVGLDDPNQKAVNLQESFAKFRDQKIKERRIMKMCQQAQLENGRTDEFKQNLRIKFVEQLKRYIGTKTSNFILAAFCALIPCCSC
ncbi:hypothetical protein EON65_24960 [archaeon]|nr:MAG: hypothetical protein EON65_24960 [archaeon]